MNLRFRFLVLAILLPNPAATPAAESIVPMDEDKSQVAAWNRFATEVRALQKKVIAAHRIRESEETGRYGGEFAKRYTFRDVSYYDADSGRLLGTLRRDGDDSASIQLVAVYLYDKAGRVIRDYSAIYLPWGRNAPIRTFINLHQYRDGLHGYRQFDASNNLLYEQCSGKFNGTDVDLGLESYQIDARTASTETYRRCFDGLPESAREYLNPH